MTTETETTGHALTWDSVIGPKSEHAVPGKRIARLTQQTPAQFTPPAEDPASYEQALLGAILLEPEKTLAVCWRKGLDRQAFRDPVRRRIYHAITKLDTAGKPIDVLALEKAADVPLALLSGLMDACTSATYAEFYVQEIVGAFGRRKLIDLTNETRKQAEAGTPLDELCAELVNQAMELQGSPSAIQPKSLAELVRQQSGDDPNELLQSRYLSKGGSLLLVAQTGVGKSSFVMQAAMTWALGLPFFEIAPARPLRTLIVQAENDEGDMAEMRDGVIDSLQLTPEQKEQVLHNIDLHFDNSHTGEAFGAVLASLLAGKSYDLIIIDPASAYHGGDSGQQADVTHFCRNIINPILTDHGCGLILVHHTTKPPKNDDRSKWQGGDWAYLGAGSAEWCNWARAVVNIESVGKIYRLRLPKRGKRIGWRTEDGAAAFTRWIAHAKEPNQIYWRDADADEIPDPGQESAREASRGRPVTPKPALEAYLPLALEIVKDRPVQVTVFRAATERLIVDNFKLGQMDARALFDILTKGEKPPLSCTKKRIGLAQFIGHPDPVFKIENDQKNKPLNF